MPIITLTTDFGSKDWFVGTMKGVILGIAPRAKLVDITHEVDPGDIVGGAFAIASSCQYFPKKTVHMAVVDPGVGGNRSPIAIQTEDYFFIGPDNGLFSLALANEKVLAIHRLENRKFCLKTISRTFHGRDVFAPAAAHVSHGLTIRKLGPAQSSYQSLPWPSVRITEDGLAGEIVYVDRFGNAITNVGERQLAKFELNELMIFGPKIKNPVRMGRYYEEVQKGQALGLIGSTGFLEIAINGGNAAKVLRLTVGDAIVLNTRRASARMLG